MMSGVGAIRETLAICRILAPGLAVAVCIGIATGWMRGRMPKRASNVVEFAAAALLLVLLGGLNMAALFELVPIEGRPAFFLDALCLHLAVYLLAFGLTFILALGVRRRSTRSAGTVNAN